jgi:hypothetical protein
MRWIGAGSEDKSAYIFDIGTAAPIERLTGSQQLSRAVVISPVSSDRACL